MVKVDIKIPAVNAVRCLLFNMIVKAIQMQALQGGIKFLTAAAQSQQCGDGHIAADAAGAFNVKIFSHLFFSISFNIRQAWTAAPNPLSIFTTEIPSAQELSMVSKGVNP